MDQQDFSQWAILEITGYNKLAGMVRSTSLGGAPFIRIDVYSSPEKIEVTKFYGPSFVYCITPVSREIAIAFTKQNFQAPVKPYELEAPEENAAENEKTTYDQNNDEWATDEDCERDYNESQLTGDPETIEVEIE